MAIVVQSAPPASEGCTPFEIDSGMCVSGAIGGGGVTLDGTITTPGDPATDTDDATNSTPGTPANCDFVTTDFCMTQLPTAKSGPVTLADIAHFHPNSVTDAVEPDGWTVAGLPTNFYGSRGTQLHDGALLGQPASVRFTPLAWTWSYGDGTSARLGTSGASWASLGIREFDPTSTSHVFRDPGTYTISLTISFSAEYRFGAGAWTPIAGELPVAANALTITVSEAKTVLVRRNCAENPTGSGC